MNTRSLVESWLNGRTRLQDDMSIEISPRGSQSLAEKSRRAYQWIAENAIFTPYIDLEFGSPITLEAGEQKIPLYDRCGYSSFLLLPLLTLFTSRRMVFIGAPGRGKTSVATLMAMLAGSTLEQARQAIQHGHPQLTIADLLGSPIPSELIRASSSRDIKVSWREWITQRVKIIDEYNRIPTKTQSALLSLMAEGYAEMYEQVIHAGRSAWFLTANDDLGGGTFPVIEALKDRIDIVVRCTPFHSQHLESLQARISTAKVVEEFLPGEILFTLEEMDQADREIRRISVPTDVLSVLGFLLGQLDFCRRASQRLEFMNKDTLALAGRRLGHVCNEDCPLDKHENLCTQTENGISPRAYQSLIHYAKALAWFRGEPSVTTEDFRQILPWVLFDKLKINPQSAFFQKMENKGYLSDRVSWIQQLFDRSIQQFAAYKPVRVSLLEFHVEMQSRLPTLSTSELRSRIPEIQQAMNKLLQNHELNGPVYDDLLRLKHLYTSFRNRLELREKGSA